MSISSINRLVHILEETEYLISASKRLQTQKELENNEDLKRSVVRSIEVIGEAVKALPQDVLAMSPKTKWSEIARMRDNLIHRYFGIRYEFVWQVIKKDIPVLNLEIQKILNSVYQQEYQKYQKLVQTEISKSSNYSYLTKQRQQEQQDIAIALLILNQYSTDYRQSAIALIIEVLRQGDRVIDLQASGESLEIEKYLKYIINQATQSQA